MDTRSTDQPRFWPLATVVALPDALGEMAEDDEVLRDLESGALALDDLLGAVGEARATDATDAPDTDAADLAALAAVTTASVVGGGTVVGAAVTSEVAQPALPLGGGASAANGHGADAPATRPARAPGVREWVRAAVGRFAADFAPWSGHSDALLTALQSVNDASDRLPGRPPADPRSLCLSLRSPWMATALAADGARVALGAYDVEHGHTRVAVERVGALAEAGAQMVVGAEARAPQTYANGAGAQASA